MKMTYTSLKISNCSEYYINKRVQEKLKASRKPKIKSEYARSQIKESSGRGLVFARCQPNPTHFLTWWSLRPCPSCFTRTPDLICRELKVETLFLIFFHLSSSQCCQTWWPRVKQRFSWMNDSEAQSICHCDGFWRFYCQVLDRNGKSTENWKPKANDFRTWKAKQNA